MASRSQRGLRYRQGEDSAGSNRYPGAAYEWDWSTWPMAPYAPPKDRLALSDGLGGVLKIAPTNDKILLSLGELEPQSVSAQAVTPRPNIFMGMKNGR